MLQEFDALPKGPGPLGPRAQLEPLAHSDRAHWAPGPGPLAHWDRAHWAQGPGPSPWSIGTEPYQTKANQPSQTKANQQAKANQPNQAKAWAQGPMGTDSYLT